MAGSLAVSSVGRWSCYCINTGTVPLTLSRAGFALDFIELRQLDPADVADVFSQKQKMTKQAKAARIAEWIGFAALLATGQNYFKIGVKAVQIVGLATYGSTKLGEYLTKEIPSTANALAGMLTTDIVLAPGASISFKTYASKMSGASHLGPRFLTQTGK